MAKGRDLGTGVADVFESLASGDKKGSKKEVQVKRKSRGRKIKQLTAAIEEYKEESESDERPKARIGRFPGTRNGGQKERISGRISPELKDAFVEWSIDERVAIGSLFERALLEFYHRHRPTDGSADA